MIITRLGGLPLNFLRPISSARAYFTAKNSPGVQRKKPPAIGIKASYPGFIAPALATSSDEVPKGERWIHEINFDGYRVQLHIANESTTVFTRRGIDWTRRFKKIANVAFLINASSAVIDGEIVVPAADGTHGLFGAAERTQGQVNEDRDGRVRPALSQRLRPAEAAACGAKIPPEKLIAKTAIQFSESFAVDGPEMCKDACSAGLEGWSPRSATAAIRPAAAMTGSRKPVRSARHCRSAGFAQKANKFDGIYLGRLKGNDWSMPARSTTLQ